MARTNAFDHDTVVRAARTLFWQHGYEGASIPELEAATGIRRSSLYNTFGSKRRLFDTAVQSYLDEVIRPRLRPLQADTVAPDAITGYLSGLHEAFENLESMPATNGCLLINTANAPIAHDPQVARVIADYRAELHAAIRAGIHAYHPTSTFTAAMQRLSEAVTGLLIAAFAIARIDPAQAARNVNTALQLLYEMPKTREPQ